MATYDLEEQEQIDALKHFWRDYGRLVLAVVLIFVLGVAGFQGWKHYKISRAQEASSQYAKLEQAITKGDVNEIRNDAGDIISQYGDTPYGAMAALVVAKTDHDAGDLDKAAERLKWAVDNAQSDDVKLVARLRLAGVLLDQDKTDEALKLLDQKVTPAFVGAYADLRGDVLVAQGKPDDAREQYKMALEHAGNDSTWRDVVQLKMDALSSQ